jgi:hypothetical protein
MKSIPIQIDGHVIIRVRVRVRDLALAYRLGM